MADNRSPDKSTKNTSAERDAKDHNAEKGSPKPVSGPDKAVSGDKKPASEQKTSKDRSSTARASSKGKSRASSSSSGSSKTSVQVSLDDVSTQVLDNLRMASSRHDYVQAVVERHLQAANPNGVFQEDDLLPGNEREVKRPTLRV